MKTIGGLTETSDRLKIGEPELVSKPSSLSGLATAEADSFHVQFHLQIVQ